MASKNTIRQYDIDAFYHIYNRGVEKRTIFIDDQDYVYFTWLLERHLSNKEHTDSKGRAYRRFDNIDLVAYCLMPNHYHLLIRQSVNPREYSDFMRSIATAYTYYFNKKYKRVGHLFQDRFKAVMVQSDSYLQHLSRYIHLNPEDPFDYRWSSLQAYLSDVNPGWVKPFYILGSFANKQSYRSFVKDHQDHKREMEKIEKNLADG